MTFREFMLENGYELQTTFWNDFPLLTDLVFRRYRTLSTVPLKSGKATASTLRNWCWY